MMRQRGKILRDCTSITWLALLAILTTSCSEHKKPSGEVQMVDPKDILFSLPTIYDPGPATDPSPPPQDHRSLHEDDWRQIEFVLRPNRAHVEGEIAKLIAFKKEHQSGPGWNDVYLRKEHPTPLSSIGLRFDTLPTLSSSALAIGGGPPWGGTVRYGFALSDGGDWFIYGQRSDNGIVVQLAVSPGQSAPSEHFARALSEIAKGGELLLVDWYACSIVDTSSPQTVSAWASRYK